MCKTIIHSVVLLAFLTSVMQESLAQTRSDNASSAATSGSKVPSAVSDDSNPKAVSAEARKEAKRRYKNGVKFGLAGLFEQAAASFLEATRLNPEFGDAYYGLGHAYFDLKRWPEAIKALERAVEINPKDMEAYAMMGHAYSNLRREQNASDQGSNSAPLGVRVSRTVTATAKSAKAASAESDDRILTTIYRVGAGDVLDVRLQNASAGQQTFYTVSATGLLEHPMLSKPLEVSGLTSEEISRLIESDLKSRAISEQPQVSVGVREYSSHTIIVSGLVKDPGTKILRREAIPLYVVLADAHPLPEAGRASVKSQQRSETILVDLADPKAMELLTRSGDVITVERAPQQFIYVGGNVKAPGEKLFRPGMTLTQAILSAGGANKKDREAELAREDSGSVLVSTKYKLKDIYSGKYADPQLLPGDRITVNH
ncbi:MAG TPA: tetratricopeptide repeat protein [Pyrinomonadaceae bacterium]|nr:tetratricopeptide repeat protein [Pyrinomonadaceae bacterium]